MFINQKTLLLLKNVPIVNDVFVKWKTKREKSNIDINDNPWIIILGFRVSSKS